MKYLLALLILATVLVSCQKKTDRHFSGSIYSVIDSTPIPNRRYAIAQIYTRQSGYTSVSTSFTTDSSGGFSVMTHQKPTSRFWISDPSNLIVDSLNGRNFGENGAVDIGRIYIIP